MRKGIHPKYETTTITCACGNVIDTKSTTKDIRVEICSSCHPYFTGKQKLMDTAGRVERFNKRYRKEGTAVKEETAVKKETAVKPEVVAKKEIVVKPEAAPKKEAAAKKEAAPKKETVAKKK